MSVITLTASSQQLLMMAAAKRSVFSSPNSNVPTPSLSPVMPTRAGSITARTRG